MMASASTKNKPNFAEGFKEAVSAISGLRVFFLVLGSLVALNVLLSLVRVPLVIIPALNVFVTIFMVATPILALYQAASARWSPALAGLLFAGGVLGQVGFSLLAAKVPAGLWVVAMLSAHVSQACLLCWCIGLGAGVALIIRDKNFLLPIAFFLAAFDIFLVLTPIGPTQILIQVAPKLLTSMGYHVNQIQGAGAPSRGPIQTLAYIGPADFMFLGAYFISLYRFGMRTKETFQWIVPTLVAYLAIVIFFGDMHFGRLSLGALPALLPIGTVVLLVNRKEWKLNGEEKMSTLVVAALSVGLVVFGMTRKPPSPKIILQPSESQQSSPGH